MVTKPQPFESDEAALSALIAAVIHLGWGVAAPMSGEDSLAGLVVGTVEYIDRVMGYSLGEDGGVLWILCHTCGRKSYNPNDIKAKYCGCCNVYHHGREKSE